MEIELGGYKVQIDEEDYERVMEHKWRLHTPDLRRHNHYYFIETYPDRSETRHTLYLHRFIMNLSLHDGKVVDHINGNTLDNRKCNLRICTKSENAKNMKKHKDNTSGFKGVYPHKVNKTFVAQITVNMKQIYLGSYKTPEEAYAVYCEASKKYHGEFGRIN